MLKFVKNLLSKPKESTKLSSEPTDRQYQLIKAIKAEDEGRVCSIISQGNMNARDENKTPVIVLLAQHQMVNAFKKALKLGARLYKRDRKKISAYQYVMESGNRELVDIAIDEDASEAGGIRRKQFPLHYSSIFENIKSVSGLINIGYDVNEPDDDGIPPLFKAIEFGNLKNAILLVKAGANPEFKDNDGNSIFHLPVRHALGREGEPYRKPTHKQWQDVYEIWKWIKEDIGLDINCRNNRAETPFFLLSRLNYNWMRPLASFTELGVDLQAKDVAGNNLLHVTPGYKDYKALLEAGLSKCDKNNAGKYPYQTFPDDSNRFEFLFVEGNNEFLKLHELIRCHDEDKALETIKNGADINQGDIHKTTPIIVAVLERQIRVVEELLKRGAHIVTNVSACPVTKVPAGNLSVNGTEEMQNHYGNAISLAVKAGSVELTDLFWSYLIKDKINTASKDEQDRLFSLWKTPAEIAGEMGTGEMISLFNRKYLIEEVTGTLRNTLRNVVVCHRNLELIGLVTSEMDESEKIDLFVSSLFSNLDPEVYNHFISVIIKAHLPEDRQTFLINKSIANCRNEITEKLYSGGFKPDGSAVRDNLFSNPTHLETMKPGDHLWKTIPHLDSFGRTGLHMLAMYGPEEALYKICKVYPELVNKREWMYGATPLHLAILTGNKDNSQVLRGHKTDETIKTHFEMTAMNLDEAILALNKKGGNSLPDKELKTIAQIVNGEKELIGLQHEWHQALSLYQRDIVEKLDPAPFQKRSKELHKKLSSICPQK